jgi:ABC-type nitrate/sulfonate/bicarbonate transport system substrate-binding protein
MNKKRMSTGPIAVFVIIAVTIAITGCQTSGSLDKITLGVETSLLPAAVWVAESKGYFQKYGLDVTIKEFDSGKASFNDMLASGVDISTVAPTPIMFNSFDRQDFSIFATFVDSYNDVKVIAHKDRGIATASDLKGKKIGTPMGTTGQFFVEAFFVYNGIRSSEVEVIDINPSDLPSALADGNVDAIVIWEPHGYNTQKLLGDKAVRLPSSDVYKETFNFMVMNDFARDNPEILKRFTKAVDYATTFIKNNKEESQKIVAERLGLDKEVTNILWDDFVFEISLHQSLIITLEDEARWAVNNDLVEAEKIPNYLDYIYIDALEEVKPEAVTIIQ